MGIFFILFSMFACHVCSKSFANKGGLTQHCKGKKHLENITAPEKRKEIDALESAALAQRQKLASGAERKQIGALEEIALAQRQKMASEAARKQIDALEEIDSLESAALAQQQQASEAIREKNDAFESAALVQRQKLLSDDANPVRGDFAEEVKSPLFDQTFLALKNNNMAHVLFRLYRCFRR